MCSVAQSHCPAHAAQSAPQLSGEGAGTIDRILFRSPRLGELFGLKPTESRTSVENRDYLGKMILMAANKGDRTTIASCVLKGGDIKYVNTAGEGAAFFAATQGLQFLQEIHEMGAPLSLLTRNLQSVPHQLARFKDPLAFEYVLSRGASLGLKTWNGATELHLAAYSGNLPVVEYLLSRGVAVDAEKDMGTTALHMASRAGFSDVIARLLSAGADPNKVTKEYSSAGDSALHLACRRKCKQSTTLLVKSGATMAACKTCRKRQPCARINAKFLASTYELIDSK